MSNLVIEYQYFSIYLKLTFCNYFVGFLFDAKCIIYSLISFVVLCIMCPNSLITTLPKACIK